MQKGFFNNGLLLVSLIKKGASTSKLIIRKNIIEANILYFSISCNDIDSSYLNVQFKIILWY